MKFIGSKDKHCRDGNHSDSRFSITVIWVGSAEGVNGSVICL